MAVANIQECLEKLTIDLQTVTVDLDEFRDIQVAFLKAGTPDCEIPTDHAIHATLLAAAAHRGVRFILSGVNVATEGGGVPAWSQGHNDWGHIRGIHKLFGTRGIRSFPHVTPVGLMWYALIRRVRSVALLDYVDDDKGAAIRTLQQELGWRYYGGKHYESIYTRSVQGYVLPPRFGFEKRRHHLSSLIWSGQANREAAMDEIRSPDYPAQLQEQDRALVGERLGVTPNDSDRILEQQPRSSWDYPSYKKSLGANKPLLSLYRIM